MTEKRNVKIEDLYEIAIVGDVNISSVGARTAFVRKDMDKEKDAYRTNIWVSDGGDPRQYTAGNKDSHPRWSPDGETMAFLSARDGANGIYTMSASGGEAVRLTDKELHVNGFTWSPDSSKIAFGAALKTDEHGVLQKDEPPKGEGKDQPKPGAKLIERIGFKADGAGFIHDRRMHIHVIDVKSKEITRLTDGDFHSAGLAWSPDGRHIAYGSNHNPRWDTELFGQIWQVSVDGGEPLNLTPQPGLWAQPAYSPDGKHIAFFGLPAPDEKPVTGFARLWRADRRGEGLTNLLEGTDLDLGDSVGSDCKIESGSFFWDKRGIWFPVSESGASNVFRWADGVHRETEGKHEVRDFSVTGDTIAYTLSDTSHPADIWLRKGKGKPKQVTDFNAKYLESVRLASYDPIAIKGAGGQKVEGWVLKPPSSGAGTYPLIMYIHGGPQTAYGYSFFHEMQLHAAEGIGVLLINPHGSSSYGEKWESSIHGDWGNKDYKDFMAAADVAAKLDWVDEKRMAVGGGSYGGYMSSWIIGHTDRFACAIIERALTNMVSFYGTTDIPNWWKHAWHTTPEEDAARLWKMSPMAYLGAMKTPTLVIHSENDHRCPVEQGEQLFVGLRRLGIPTRFVRFPDESHGLSRGGTPTRRVQRLTEIGSWLRRYL